MLTESQWQKRVDEGDTSRGDKPAHVSRFYNMIVRSPVRIEKEDSRTYFRYLGCMMRPSHKIIIDRRARTIMYENVSSVLYEVVGSDLFFDTLIDAIESKVER